MGGNAQISYTPPGDQSHQHFQRKWLRADSRFWERRDYKQSDSEDESGVVQAEQQIDGLGPVGFVVRDLQETLQNFHKQTLKQPLPGIIWVPCVF